MISAILDASALLALLRREPGGEKVGAVLAQSAITVVNLSEIIAHLSRNGVGEGDIRLLLDPLPVEPIPFDEELAYMAGLMIVVTKPAGLSFGDRACLALAKRAGVKAMTEDRNWQRIAGSLGIEIDLIR